MKAEVLTKGLVRSYKKNTLADWGCQNVELKMRISVELHGIARDEYFVAFL